MIIYSLKTSFDLKVLTILKLLMSLSCLLTRTLRLVWNIVPLYEILFMTYTMILLSIFNVNL